MALVAVVLLVAATTRRAGARPARLAIVVGNNVGSPTRQPLRFAETDARRFAQVVSAHGGVSNVRLMLNGTPAGLRALFDELQRLGPAALPKVILFYYSGHADRDGLEMGAEKLPFAELRKRLAGLGSELVIAFVDACESGRLTRAKGGRTVHVEVEPPSTYKGQVFITSSAASENAHEADDLGGGVFTHYLISGLSGAADRSGNRQVSLSEAYAFAYRHTLARSARTPAAAQHPRLDMNAHGHGELVLTRLGKGKSYLRLHPSLSGPLAIRAGAGGRVVADLLKERGEPVLLAATPGLYQVLLGAGSRQRAALVSVVAGRTAQVTPQLFGAAGRLSAKGGALTAEHETGDASQSERSPNRVFLGYGVRSGFLQDSAPLHRVRLGYARRVGPVALGLGLAYGTTAFERTDGIGVTLHEVAGSLLLGVPVAVAHWAIVVPELELEGGWIQQRGEQGGAAQTLETQFFEYRVRLGMQLDAGQASFGFAVHVGQVVYQAKEGVVAPFVGGGTVSMGVRF